MAKQNKGILESLLDELEKQGKKGYKLNFTDDRMVMNLPPEARPPRKYDVNQGLQEISGSFFYYNIRKSFAYQKV